MSGHGTAPAPPGQKLSGPHGWHSPPSSPKYPGRQEQFCCRVEPAGASELAMHGKSCPLRDQWPGGDTSHLRAVVGVHSPPADMTNPSSHTGHGTQLVLATVNLTSPGAHTEHRPVRAL